MKTTLAFLALCSFSLRAFAFADYDPFADATAFGGTSYSTGAALIGQTNAAGRTWVNANTSYVGSNVPLIAPGNLTISGLMSSQGNSLQFGGVGNVGRFGFTAVGAPITNGVVFYSFAMQLKDLTGINAGSGAFWAGLNNSLGAQAAQPTQVGTRVITKAAPGGYNIGTSKNSSTAADFMFHPTTFTTNDVLFVVGSYTIGTGSTTDDSSSMWINPSSSTFGALTAPAADLTTAAGADINLSQIASFLVFNRAGTPGVTILDELRVGSSWADVTPVPEPTTLALLGIGALFLASRRLRRD